MRWTPGIAKKQLGSMYVKMVDQSRYNATCIFSNGKLTLLVSQPWLTITHGTESNNIYEQD